MKYPFLYERNPNTSPVRCYIYFSSISIKIKVIAQNLGVGRYFGESNFFNETH